MSMPFDDIFSQIEDQPIIGGCHMCDAYQVLETLEPGVHSLIIHHDDDCPILLASRSRTN
jgi:hypothetical protein